MPYFFPFSSSHGEMTDGILTLRFTRHVFTKTKVIDRPYFEVLQRNLLLHRRPPDVEEVSGVGAGSRAWDRKVHFPDNKPLFDITFAGPHLPRSSLKSCSGCCIRRRPNGQRTTMFCSRRNWRRPRFHCCRCCSYCYSRQSGSCCWSCSKE